MKYLLSLCFLGTAFFYMTLVTIVAPVNTIAESMGAAAYSVIFIIWGAAVLAARFAYVSREKPKEHKALLIISILVLLSSGLTYGGFYFKQNKEIGQKQYKIVLSLVVKYDQAMLEYRQIKNKDKITYRDFDKILQSRELGLDSEESECKNNFKRQLKLLAAE